MQKKTLLLATFITEEYLDKFLYRIYKKHGIKKKSVFLFETDDNQLLLTFKLFLEFDQKIDIRKEFPKTIQIHKKGTTFFTINSLNRLIEKEFGIEEGNADYSKFNIDWDKYQNTMISLKEGNLEILNLTRKIIE
jgi:hypothetical protein